jgi:transposase
MHFCGIDVSRDELVVALRRAERDRPLRCFANTVAGRQQLLAWMTACGTVVRVTMEATGVYSLDLALLLSRAEGVELAVVNPRRARRFAESLGERSKNDPLDARALREYAVRMPFVPWQAPTPTALALREIARHIQGLTEMRAATRNRWHAACSSAVTSACIRRELQPTLTHLQASIRRLLREADRLRQQDPGLERQYQLLRTIGGIGELSALQILAEVTLLAGRGVRQWVKHSGLDVREHSSGRSIRKQPRISKCGNRYLRRALYRPALVASPYNPALRDFYDHLRALGKTKLQALVAVMRKLLHAISGMFRHDQPYDGARLCPASTLPSPELP